MRYILVAAYHEGFEESESLPASYCVAFLVPWETTHSWFKKIKTLSRVLGAMEERHQLIIRHREGEGPTKHVQLTPLGVEVCFLLDIDECKSTGPSPF